VLLHGMRYVRSRGHRYQPVLLPTTMTHPGYRQARGHLWLLFVIVSMPQKMGQKTQVPGEKRQQGSLSPLGTNTRTGAIGTTWREGGFS